MANKTITKGDKIMLFLAEALSSGDKKALRYEDIVVGVFKKYPNDFHLKGYVEYPDSGDLIHKPLYSFRKKGYIQGGNKIFSLTPQGIEYANNILNGYQDKDIINNNKRLSRSSENEVNRIKSLEGFKLFAVDNKDKIVDNDLYAFLNITARTSIQSTEGRLNVIKELLQEIKIHSDSDALSGSAKIYKNIIDYHNFLIEKYNIHDDK